MWSSKSPNGSQSRTCANARESYNNQQTNLLISSSDLEQFQPKSFGAYSPGCPGSGRAQQLRAGGQKGQPGCGEGIHDDEDSQYRLLWATRNGRSVPPVLRR